MLGHRDAAGKGGGVAAHLGAALHPGVAADRHQPRARPADVAAREREVHDRLDVVDAGRVLRDAHRPHEHRRVRVRVHAREPLHVGAGRARERFEPVERFFLQLLEEAVEAERCRSVTNRRSMPPSREQLLHDAVEERRRRRRCGRRRTRRSSSCRTSRSRRSTAPSSARGPGSRSGFTTAIARAALLREVQVLHEDGLRIGDVGTEQHDEVTVDDVPVGARRRRDSERLLQRVRRRRMTDACRVVDVVRADEPRRLLRRVVHLVRDAARREVEAEALRTRVAGSDRRRDRARRPTTRAGNRDRRGCRTIGCASRPSSRSARPSSCVERLHVVRARRPAAPSRC